MDIAIARPELLQVADAVAREKTIDREEVLEAMEQAIQKAGRAKYGHEKDIRATIDRLADAPAGIDRTRVEAKGDAAIELVRAERLDVAPDRRKFVGAVIDARHPCP